LEDFLYAFIDKKTTSQFHELSKQHEGVPLVEKFLHNNCYIVIV